MFKKFKQHQFLFEELVRRDFKKKYKGSFLGIGWSLLSPLLQLLVMALVFSQFFGRDTPHYIIYLFCGNLIFTYFSEATKTGMEALISNSKIFTKVNVPKPLFLLAKNSQTFISFCVTLVVFFLFVALDKLPFTWKFLCLLYPLVLLVLFNIGCGLILSSIYVFFRDTFFIYDVVLKLLSYMSAIFYNINNLEQWVQNLFHINPVFLFIKYFRSIVIDSVIPPLWFHALMLFDVVLVLCIGIAIYKKYDTEFMYYV